jgi:hypothetical protein
MRSDDGQTEMLLALYRGLGDDQLLDMAEQSDDLTDAARAALADVMRERRLSLANADEPDVPQQADEPDEHPPVGVDERVLWTFEDAFQASEAIRLLTGAGVWHRMSEETRAIGGGSQVLVGLMVIVQAEDHAAAVTLLRAKMGLFPLAEVEGAGGSPLSGMDGTVLLSMFDREEALAAADALGRAGISYWWRDGKQEVDELPDAGTVAIEVTGERLAEATAVVDERLAELS